MPSIMKKTRIDSAIDATLFNGFKWCMSSLVLSPNLSIDFLMKNWLIIIPRTITIILVTICRINVVLSKEVIFSMIKGSIKVSQLIDFKADS